MSLFIEITKNSKLNEITNVMMDWMRWRPWVQRNASANTWIIDYVSFSLFQLKWRSVGLLGFWLWDPVFHHFSQDYPLEIPTKKLTCFILSAIFLLFGYFFWYYGAFLHTQVKNTVRLVGAEIRTVLNEVSVRNMSVINQNTVRNRKLSTCSKTVRISAPTKRIETEYRN